MKIFVLFLLVFFSTSIEVMSFANENKPLLDKITEFDYDSVEMGLTQILWDGSQYIGVHHKGIIYSTDGLNWTNQDIGIIGPENIASSGKNYSITGIINDVDDINDPQYKGSKKNNFTRGFSTKYPVEMSVASSTDGMKWKPISGIAEKLGNCGGWCYQTKLFFNKKFVLFDVSNIYFSNDGEIYKPYSYFVRDPKKLTPKGYLYLGEGGISPENIIYDGRKYITYDTDYFGSSISTSLDGINWNIVYFNKDKYLLMKDTNDDGEKRKIIFLNNEYNILTSKGTLLVSKDGTAWKEKNISASDAKRMPSLHSRLVNARTYCDGEYCFFQNRGADGTELEKLYGSKCIVTKDFNTFYEVNFGEPISGIIYMNNNILVTQYQIIDVNVVKKLIDAATLIKK